METLLQQLDKGVLVLTINRPNRENRVDRMTGAALRQALEAARANEAVRSVVLTGAGGVFCLGGDMDGFPGGSPVQYLNFARAFGDVLISMSRLGKPLIAAVNGDALAGGFSLLAGCDMAVASDAARFGLPELDYGLFPLLALAATRELVPPKFLFEIIYEGRLLNAKEACAMHLVNRSVPAERVVNEAISLAERIGLRSSVAVSIGRDAFYAMRGMTPETAVDYARAALATMLSTEDGAEAGRAKREGRAPVFSGR
ncbi:MAG: enoyl-CoA hydratase/isomerase family protein [Betaproteobacteria bacterium]|nr:MAG: enoyl-CoA hydratase/isomerase family protein [Betaproteobacteria bacterium]